MSMHNVIFCRTQPDVLATVYLPLLANALQAPAA